MWYPQIFKSTKSYDVFNNGSKETIWIITGNLRMTPERYRYFHLTSLEEIVNCLFVQLRLITNASNNRSLGELTPTHRGWRGNLHLRSKKISSNSKTESRVLQHFRKMKTHIANYHNASLNIWERLHFKSKYSTEKHNFDIVQDLKKKLYYFCDCVRISELDRAFFM